MIRLRASGKEPELWHSDNGSAEPASYTIKADKTVVPLHLEERESVFIILDKKTGVLSTRNCFFTIQGTDDY